MSWERDPLWAKSKLYFERAFDESRDDPMFGLWCSLGLEFLARAALAAISPTLLAEPDRDHKYLLHALNRGSERFSRRSITTAQVLSLCRSLYEDFSEQDFKSALALINRRNDELHTGAAAFAEYPPRMWISGFYRACRSLAAAMDESLETLFGEDEATAANEILAELQSEVRDRTLKKVAAHRSVFEAKTSEEQAILTEKALRAAQRLSFQRHHRVECPACTSDATVQGKTFGRETVKHTSDGIEVRQAVSPKSLICLACGLQLEGYAELDAAQLGGHYTRTTTYTPEDYYGLADPEEFDVEEYRGETLREYDND